MTSPDAARLREIASAMRGWTRHSEAREVEDIAGRMEDAEQHLALHMRCMERARELWMATPGADQMVWPDGADNLAWFAARLDAAPPVVPEDVLRAINALRRAEQLAEVATDWNLDGVEIDGEMMPTTELADEFRAAIRALLPQPPAPEGEEGGE